ncbi:MAG: hypothetical protein FWC71_05910 [Defluviitaleaceae bacterium]|nr:hypothetical protein [Defluviitaleaceae bacterium]
MFEGIPITTNDLLNAALIAVGIVIIIRLLGFVVRQILARTREIAYDPERAQEVRNRCSVLFPVEKLTFDGATFSRGAIVRVITHRQLAIEGEFMGTNHSDMLCLVTRETIVAQELQAIATIQVIRQPGGAR